MAFGRGKLEEPTFEVVSGTKVQSPGHQVDGRVHHGREQRQRPKPKVESRRDGSSSPRKSRHSASPRKNRGQSSSPRRRSVASPRNTVNSPKSSTTTQRNAIPSPRNAVKSQRNAIGSPKSIQSRSAACEKDTDAPTRTVSPAKSRTGSQSKHGSLSLCQERYSKNPSVSSQPLLQGGMEVTERSNRTESIGYRPPHVSSNDSLDDMVSRIGQEKEDKYTSLAGGEESLESALTKPKESRYTRPNDTFMTVTPVPPVIQPPGHQSVALRNPVSEITTQSYEGTDGGTLYTKEDGTYYSDANRTHPSKTPQRELLSMSTIDSERFLSREEALWSDDDYIVMKQKIAYLCIVVSAIQLGVLLIQLILCGVASVSVNPMIGPFPDAFSEWGGKNAYLMIEDHQYFRLVTPAFLNVGLLHLLINVFCQLETCAFFEREWGSCRWLVLYLISSVGCVATSSVFNPDDIAVCSSGAIMGLFGAKIAQVITWTAFELRSHAYFDSAQLDQLGGVMCSAALVSLLSFVTYIEWSGHMGGFAAGFFAGMFMFCRPIASVCSRLIWGFTGLVGLFGGAFFLGHMLLDEVSPDEDLEDACQYFRNLYPEGYDCECVWN